MTIAVELTRAIDGPELLAALQAGGVSGELADDGREMIVEADDGDKVARLIDEWASGNGLPFVPVQLDPASYALVPPAG
jgi:hypothetical protein